MTDHTYDDMEKMLKEKGIARHLREQIAWMYDAAEDKPAFLQRMLSAFSSGRIPRDIGVPRRITLLSDGGCYGSAPAHIEEITMQKVTVTDKGRAFLTHYNYARQVLCKEQFCIPPIHAILILKAIGDLFSVYPEEPAEVDGGWWDLMITDQTNQTHSFSGDLSYENGSQLIAISALMRTALGRESLLAFGGSDGKTAFYGCEFEFGSKRYSYKAEGLLLRIGDRVIVPCGNDGRTAIATVAEVAFFEEDHFPFPIKSIIGKVEPKPPASACSVFELVKSVIDAIDCEDLLELGCPADEYDGESKKIAEKIDVSMCAYQVAGIIAEVMSYSFHEIYEASSFIIAGAQIVEFFKNARFMNLEIAAYRAEQHGTWGNPHMDYEYVAATEELLHSIWEKNVKANPDDERWLRWREEAIANNACGKAKTFLVLFKGEPVGEGTLLFAEDCSAIRGRTVLADGGKTANINALRIEKEHEGKGHISKLVHVMERYAAEHGYQTLTIGVEAKESRTLAIYLHWGYQALVHAETEDDCLVLYYAKGL